MVRKDKITDITVVPVKDILPITIKAIPAIMLPVIIIVGIRMGVFTPTEGGAVACVYAFLVSTLINRQLKLSMIPKLCYDAMRSTAVVMFIVGGASAVGWMITMADVPAQLVDLMSGLVEHKILLLIVLNILLLALGMVMDITPITLIFTPVLFPLVEAAGIDLYYFAVIMIINLCLGLLTPPVGTVLYIGCSVSNLKMGQVVKGIAPFLIAEFIFLILCLIFPAIIMAPAS